MTGSDLLDIINGLKNSEDVQNAKSKTSRPKLKESAKPKANNKKEG